jgi:lipopolysaccharide export system protein LptC
MAASLPRRMDRYSRLVAWLKIVLPLIALAILSTLFLVSRTIDPSQTIPYANVDVRELAREQRVGAPSYQGMTSAGAAVSFEAESVKLGGEGARAEAPRARIEFPGGRTVTVSATGGLYDGTAATARLVGQAILASSDGYRVETEAVRADLASGGMETLGEVRGVAPYGELTAGKARLVLEPDGTYLLSFEAGVKLIYRPER